MFGVPMSSNVDTETSEDELKTNGEGKKAEDVEAQPSSSLIGDEVIPPSSSMHFVYFGVCQKILMKQSSVRLWQCKRCHGEKGWRSCGRIQIHEVSPC